MIFRGAVIASFPLCSSKSNYVKALKRGSFLCSVIIHRFTFILRFSTLDVRTIAPLYVNYAKWCTHKLSDWIITGCSQIKFTINHFFLFGKYKHSGFLSVHVEPVRLCFAEKKNHKMKVQNILSLHRVHTSPLLYSQHSRASNSRSGWCGESLAEKTGGQGFNCSPWVKP